MLLRFLYDIQPRKPSSFLSYLSMFFSHIFLFNEDSSTISNPETRSNSSFQSYFSLLRQRSKPVWYLNQKALQGSSFHSYYSEKAWATRFFSHIFLCYEDSSTISNPKTRSNSSFQSYFSIIRQSLYGIETKKPCSAHLFILIIPNWESLSNSFS